MEKSGDNELSFKLINFEVSMGLSKWRYPAVIEKYDLEHERKI